MAAGKGLSFSGEFGLDSFIIILSAFFSTNLAPFSAAKFPRDGPEIQKGNEKKVKGELGQRERGGEEGRFVLMQKGNTPTQRKTT
jgi:hypothetical protein